MNKGDLVKAIAEEAGISKLTASKAVESFLGGIIKTLKAKDGKMSLIGFGTFKKTKRKARTGRNPKTGETIKIKAGNSIHFKPGKALKEAV